MKGNGKTYTSNFAQTVDDVDGNPMRLKVGDTFTGISDHDATFLIEQGRITEGRSGGLGRSESAVMPSAGEVSTMTRDQLLRELGTGASDDQLRAAVVERRAREAEAGASLAGATLTGGTAGSGDDAGDVFDAAKFVDRNLDEITDEELAKLTPEQRGDVRKAEEARTGGARVTLTAKLDELDKPPA